jgi:hypothetical protein
MHLRTQNGRQWTRYPNHIRVFCERFTLGDPYHDSRATAENLSREGILIALEERVRVGEYLIIELPSGRLFARVIHVSSQPDGRSAAGCQFTRLLSEEELQAVLKSDNLQEDQAREIELPPWVRAPRSAALP